jgi:parallel beta helix pectate lyase-like protein
MTKILLNARPARTRRSRGAKLRGMTGRRRALACALLAVAAAGLGACGGGDGDQAERVRTLRVPAQYPTVQRAVDEARPGDLVLIAPGTYHESISVPDETRDVVIRGEDRNRVVLDGRDRLADGIAVHGDGVAVENLTVRRYQVNGVVWSPEAGYDDDRQLQGWRGSYLTAFDNGLYGVYAFGAEHGRFDHVHASGHPDSGVYVGRCKPCHALVRDSVAERNHVGYEATNASGDVVVTRNRWVRNRVGVQLNSLRKEAAFPQAGSLLAGNEIADNQAREAPRGSAGFGAGVVVNGGVANVVRDNRISGHVGVGVIVLDSQDAAAADNTVRRNVLSSNRVDLALRTRDGRSHGTCFAGNQAPAAAAVTVTPAGLQRRTAGSCGRSVALGAAPLHLPPAPPQVDYRSVPAPPPQPNMPGATSAPPQPASGRPELDRR